MVEYIYHCNAQNPTGEDAFRNMNVFFFWAKSPMIKRVTELPKEIPMTVLHGAATFFDHRTAYEIKYARQNSKVNIWVVGDAGHDIHVDNAKEFNRIVNEILQDSKDGEILTRD